MSPGAESRDRQRWAELKSLFNAAVEQPAEDWPSLVSRLRDHDPEQADQLQRLLDGHLEALIQVDPHDIQVDPHDPEDLAPGTTIGPYVIAGLIGEGGMGRVYRAKDARLGRDVAIKVLPPDLAHDRERRVRMEREALAMGMLNHPNIVTVHDIGDFRGSPYIVSELLEGETLRQRVTGEARARVRLAPDAAVEIVVAVAAALGAAHARGIVHRDIKPENVFLCSDGRIKVLDFGIAKLVDGGTSGGATMTGAIVGTLGYITPEQLRGQPVRPEADVYACGIVLYELIAGVRPFTGDSQAALIGAILLQPAPRLAGVAPALDALVARCLAKEPDARCAHGTALAGELRALRGVVAGLEVDPREQPTQRLGESPRVATKAGAASWRRPMAAALSAIALAGVVGLVWRAQREGDSPAAQPVIARPESASPPAAKPSPTEPEPQRREVPPPSSPAPAPEPRGTPTTRKPGTLPQLERQPTAPPAAAPQAAAAPPPAILSLSGIWTFSEDVTEAKHAIACSASGGLQLQAGDGTLDGTLQLKEACQNQQGATDSNNAVVSLKAGAISGDAVSFVTQSDNEGMTTTCSYTGKIVGSARATMRGEVECDSRQAGSSEVLTPRGTWRANRTTP